MVELPGLSSLDKHTALSALPPQWPHALLPEIRQRVQAAGRKIVVLDDDPTGTQTVYDIPVLTSWTVPLLEAELCSSEPLFFILTNSRSLPLPAAYQLNTEIAANLSLAARATGKEFVVISRSDSTLRGHFPGELEALQNTLGIHFDGWLLVPFFLEGGRYTLEDIHYVAEGDRLVPAGQTEFAADKAFGYRSSDLRLWVEEKTQGKVLAGQVLSISLDDLRRGGPEWVQARLRQVSGGQVCVVNAAAPRDLEVLAAALLAVEAEGQRFLYRTAASFVQIRAGLEPRGLLTPGELELPAGRGALVLAGSYVPKTTVQLQALMSARSLLSIELKVADLLDERCAAERITHAAEQANQAIASGRDVLVSTSRQLVSGTDAADSLRIGARVSRALVQVVQALQQAPRFLVAKGGITSSDLATQGLNVRKAQVLGQALPGVPVWRLGKESRFPGLAYVVFPGNVGGPEALVDLLDRFALPEKE